MTIQSAVIFNAKSTHFFMNSTIHISDAGSQKAVVHSCNATLSYNGETFGYIQLPNVNVDPANPSSNILSLSNQVILITQRKVFQASAASVINGHDTPWDLECKTSIQVHAGVTLHVSVTLKKTMILPGSPLVLLRAENLDVISANESHLTTTADITFVKLSKINFALPLVGIAIAVNGTHIGTGQIGPMSISTGINSLKQTSLVIHKTPDNTEVLSKFFSAYMMRVDQNITMTGPFAINGNATVIDGIMNETVTVAGSNKGNLALGGLVNSKTMMGWPRTINQSQGSSTIRGAYAAMANPLTINMTIHDMVTRLDLNYDFAYMLDVKLAGMSLISANCSIPHHAFSQMKIGAGMFPDVTKTSVHVAGHSQVSYLVFAGPQPYPIYPYGRKDAQCKVKLGPAAIETFPFSCCWASITTAAACYKNHAAQKDPKNAQLDETYIDATLYGNISVELGKGFNITIRYKQDFFPLYFGYEIYAGFLTGAEMNCESFKFL